MHTLGLLALQGDYYKHGEKFNLLGAETCRVRQPEDLDTIDALIMPGGESTTMGILLERTGLLLPLKEKIKAGLPVFATCAGLIILAKKVVGYSQVHLGVLDVDVERNAYGRQTESFEADFNSEIMGDKPVRGVFIRAPQIKRTGPGVKILAYFEKIPVLVRQDNILAGSFHPELTDDLRIQEYFLSMLEER